jgi:hypothetical protein
MYDDPTPVHEDKSQSDAWVNDLLGWRDVYSKKPTEYLEAIARGETPRWDSDKGGYAYGDSTSSEVMLGGDPQSDSETDTELPF